MNVEATEGGEQSSMGSGGGRCEPGYGAEPRNKKCVSKMKKTLFDRQLMTMCRVPRACLDIQTVDGRFSDGSGVLIQYFDHVCESVMS